MAQHWYERLPKEYSESTKFKGRFTKDERFYIGYESDPGDDIKYFNRYEITFDGNLHFIEGRRTLEEIESGCKPRITKNWERMHNHYQRLHRAYISASLYGQPSHEEILARWKEIDATTPKKFPRYYADMLRGMREYIVGDELYKRDLKWVVLEKDGVQYEDWAHLPEDMKELLRGSAVKSSDGAGCPHKCFFHAYRTTGKPFGEPKGEWR